MEPEKKQIVCITGVSSGIGRELGKQLVRSGHTVIGIARRKNLLEDLTKELGGKNFYYYEADVSSLTDLEKIKIDLVAKNLLPNVVVCGASIYAKDTEGSYDNDAVRKIMEINFFGTANMVEVLLPEMLKGNKGHFVSLSSIASWRPNIRGAAYPASKAAVGMLFRGLDLKYRVSGVNFSTVYLGPVLTDMWEGKPSFIVASPHDIAARLARLIARPKPVSYMPFLSTTLSRLCALIPDKLYATLSSLLFK